MGLLLLLPRKGSREKKKIHPWEVRVRREPARTQRDAQGLQIYPPVQLQEAAVAAVVMSKARGVARTQIDHRRTTATCRRYIAHCTRAWSVPYMGAPGGDIHKIHKLGCPSSGRKLTMLALTLPEVHRDEECCQGGRIFDALPISTSPDALLQCGMLLNWSCEISQRVLC